MYGGRFRAVAYVARRPWATVFRAIDEQDGQPVTEGAPNGRGGGTEPDGPPPAEFEVEAGTEGEVEVIDVDELERMPLADIPVEP